MSMKMSDTYMYTENILKSAEQALVKPEDFGYWGSEDMFVTWGFCGIDKTRDSNVMDISNFEVITKELMNKYPNDFRIETYNHWLCGWVNRLICRVLNDGLEVIHSNISEAFESAMICKDKLNDYPIYDQDDYYDRLYKEAIDCLYDLPDYLEKMIDTDVVNYGEDIHYELTANMNIEFDVDGEQYPKDEQILLAVYNLQIWNTEAIEEWNEWTSENNRESILTAKKNPNQLNLFED